MGGQRLQCRGRLWVLSWASTSVGCPGDPCQSCHSPPHSLSSPQAGKPVLQRVFPDAPCSRKTSWIPLRLWWTAGAHGRAPSGRMLLVLNKVRARSSAWLCLGAQRAVGGGLGSSPCGGSFPAQQLRLREYGGSTWHFCDLPFEVALQLVEQPLRSTQVQGEGTCTRPLDGRFWKSVGTAAILEKCCQLF